MPVLLAAFYGPPPPGGSGSARGLPGRKGTINMIPPWLEIKLFVLIIASFVPVMCASSKKPTDWKIRGTSLGGAFVLEPWITPTLFYQFQVLERLAKLQLPTVELCAPG